jgi:hypothetical protein
MPWSRQQHGKKSLPKNLGRLPRASNTGTRLLVAASVIEIPKNAWLAVQEDLDNATEVKKTAKARIVMGFGRPTESSPNAAERVSQFSNIPLQDYIWQQHD